jgi:diguanylate cyclase (GGDEF)-like protein
LIGITMPRRSQPKQQRRILVVEDSPFFLNVTHRRLESDLGVVVLDATNLAEARRIIEREGDKLFLCILDIVLPDAPHGEVVDLAVEKGLPCIVFTSMFSDEVREEVLSKPVIDYVTKDSPASLDFMTHLIRRLVSNAETKVLVVDDSRSARRYVVDLLSLYRFQVLEANDGADALDSLNAHPDIRLIVTDYFMPNMDGFELVKRVRQTHPPAELAIIGLSSSGSGPLSARFIKNGANDFLNKPFLREEFFCRVSQNMDNLDYIRDLARAAQYDPLTDLYNRRFLFEAAEPFLAQARRDGRAPVVAMMDIDHFKTVNDTYGHDAGDTVLIGVAETLRRFVRRRSDILARVGGEEFCLFLPEIAPDAVGPFFESLRRAVSDSPVPLDDDSGTVISVTVSIGVCDRSENTFRDMLRNADRCLYAAKRAGRNRVCIDSEDPLSDSALLTDLTDLGT